MAARLTIAKGAFAGRRFPFDESISLGRAPDNGVVVNHPQVSSRHARIVRRGDGEYVLEDNDSRNGTFLAGTRIHGAESLGRLDVIDLGGGVELIFQILVPDPRPGSRAAARVEAARVEAARRSQSFEVSWTWLNWWRIISASARSSSDSRTRAST